MILTAEKTAIAPGLYPGVPFSTYESWPYWNASTIKVLLSDSPRAMRHTIDHGRESSESMDLGKAEHVCVFEPDAFDARYITWLGGRRAGKAWDEFRLACDEMGREILTESEYDRCLTMRASVRSHQSASVLLAGGGQAEISMVWDDPTTGLRCKGRMDWLQQERRRLTDLKTALDPKPFPFSMQCAKLLYHVSIGAYMDGLATLGIPIDSAHFIVVGNKPWHDVVHYQISDSAIRWGRKLWWSGLQRTSWCERHGCWPGFSDEPYPLELPTWACPDDESDDVSIGDEAAFNTKG